MVNLFADIGQNRAEVTLELHEEEQPPAYAGTLNIAVALWFRISVFSITRKAK